MEGQDLLFNLLTNRAERDRVRGAFPPSPEVRWVAGVGEGGEGKLKCFLATVLAIVSSSVG